MKSDDIVTIINIDWKYIITSLLIAIPIISSCILCFVKLWSQFKKKFGITTKRDKERELLIKTSESLASLQLQHDKSVEQSIKHDQLIKDGVKILSQEIHDCINEIQCQVDQFAENRIHDREQSFRIQKELTDGIKSIADGSAKREQLINAVMVGNRELLGAEIDRRFDKYIGLQGIPADELDEFISLHNAYKGCLGNHNRDAKFNYIIDNLSVLPVESKLKNES